MARRRSSNYGALARLGVARVVELVQQHRYNLTDAAQTLGVSRTVPGQFLSRKGPRLLERWRQEGKIRRGARDGRSTRSVYRISDRNKLLLALRRYGYVFVDTARALGVHPITVSRSLHRLAPDVYERLVAERRQRAVLAERRRNRPKQDPALHPWRRKWLHKEAA